MSEEGIMKVRLLRILEIMRKTDEKHPLNATQICEELKRRFNIVAERKAVGRDLKCLDAAGYTIVKCDNHNAGAYMIDQLFEDYELKIIADAICSAHFMTEQDTEQLLKKIKNMATDEGESIIEDTAFFDKLLKSEDKQNKNKIDTLIRAIREKKKIKFKYFEYGENAKKAHKRKGHEYHLSPYFLALHDNEYFLIANSASNDGASHFRLEMIDELEITEETARPIREIVDFYDENKNRLSVEEYLRKTLDMWSGKPENIVLECKYDAYNDIMNTFGRNVRAYSFKKDTCRVKIQAVNNPGFYHWLAGKGTDIKVVMPLSVKRGFCDYIREISDSYIDLE